MPQHCGAPRSTGRWIGHRLQEWRVTIPKEIKRKPEQTITAIAEMFTAIGELDRPGCLDCWREVFGRPPPKHLSLQFMKRVLTWELQNRELGRLSTKTERRLRHIAAGKTPIPKARPGSHLVREWNGRTYQVEVVDGGYVLDGKSWRSLSAIAKHITGAHWSGPRFFGVQ